MNETDIVIIGAGPAGITAALYLERAGKKFVWLEKGAPGGKLLNVHEVSNYPGRPKESGFDLAMGMLENTSALGVHSEYGMVISVQKDGDFFIVKTDAAEYEAKAVLVASGLSNVPLIKGEKERVGHGVSYCATCDGPLYRHKRVILEGNGERALEEALYLSRLVEHLDFVVPDETLKGNDLLAQELLSQTNVSFFFNAKIAEISGDSPLECLLADGRKLMGDAVFPLSGEKSASAFLTPLKLALNHGFIPVGKDMQSEVPGLFAAGDIVDKPLRQAINAAGDGASASAGIIAYLNRLGQKR